MGNIRIVRDIEECAYLWNKHYPLECIFDFWDVRYCFSDAYDRPTTFIVYEEDGCVLGLLPLSLLTEEGSYAFFPGETWEGKTWIEQNKIIVNDKHALQAMLEALPGKTNLRYLCDAAYSPGILNGVDAEMLPDETGYIFSPARYGYAYESYLETLSNKSRKKILSEVNQINQRGVEISIDQFGDVDKAFQLNLDSYGERSYFYDPRFMDAFERLIDFLAQREMLRVVTLRVGGTIAAVDIGAIYKKSCVFLAGGTHREFPGVAKVINLHHMEWACREKMDELDFLCGDFGWKERFRLTRRHLYQINAKRPHRNRRITDRERIQAYA